jgi:hypothetical protein
MVAVKDPPAELGGECEVIHMLVEKQRSGVQEAGFRVQKRQEAESRKQERLLGRDHSPRGCSLLSVFSEP